MVLHGKDFEDCYFWMKILTMMDSQNLCVNSLDFLPNLLIYRKIFALSDASKYYISKLASKYIHN